MRPASGDGSPYASGIAAMEGGDYAAAIAHFTRAVERRDRAALALSKRGVCRVRTGDRGAAARDFAAALDADPACVPALVNLGNLALEANMLEEAQARYEAALRIDERSATAHHNLGIVFRRTGRIADSVRELRRAAMLEAQPSKVIERIKDLWRRRM